MIPFFRKAGHPLQRVLTDRGSEFKGALDQACQSLGIRHTRTKPRHAFTNGFVERLQQTILHEHWRIEFRRFDSVFTDLFLPGIRRAVSFFLSNLGWRVEEASPEEDSHHWVALRTAETDDNRHDF